MELQDMPHQVGLLVMRAKRHVRNRATSFSGWACLAPHGKITATLSGYVVQGRRDSWRRRVVGGG
eukprot:2519573-Pyramimonas_sp.AAC.1